MTRALFCTIAGSDCSGGAGIQADMKTAHNLGCDVTTVLTAVTAQHAHGVDAINPLSIEVISQQLAALENMQSPKVIKIGLLANIQQVMLVADYLAQAKQVWDVAPLVVYDPVAIASNGDSLTEENILPTVQAQLFPLVDVLTPNIPELQALTGVYPLSWDCLQQGAEHLLAQGVAGVVIKGGHNRIDDAYCIDYASYGAESYWLASNTNDTEHTHGSGCTFASALAALLAQGYLLRDAFTLAKTYVNQGLRLGADYDGCYGPVRQSAWPKQAKDYPQVLVTNSALAHQLDWDVCGPNAPSEMFEQHAFSPLEQPIGLYPVVDSVEWVKRLLSLGIKTIQYRNKSSETDVLCAAIQDVIALGEVHQAQVFINDHWQLAMRYGAFGVHLGQEDLHSADLTAIAQAGLRLGISTHGYYELLLALEYQPSYIAIGAIFPTQTKDMSGQIQGVDTLRHLIKLQQDWQINRRRTAIPLVAIGGINQYNIEEVHNAGVEGIAVVSAITRAEDPDKATMQLLELMNIDS